MSTAASPVSVPDRALAICAGELGFQPSLQMRLEEIGGAFLANVLIALERGFGIDLDADEALDAQTIDGLVQLVEARAAGRGRLIHWDDERARRGRPLIRRGTRLRLVPDCDDPRVERGDVIHDGPMERGLPGEPDPSRFYRPIATPSDEAWERAARIHRRERWGRVGLLALAALCALGAVAGAAWWADFLRGLI